MRFFRVVYREKGNKRMNRSSVRTRGASFRLHARLIASLWHVHLRRTRSLILTSLAVIFSLLPSHTAWGLKLSDTPNEKTWITDGPVYAITRLLDTIYIGGSFNYVGPYTGHGVPLDTLTGKPSGAFPFVDGPSYYNSVYASTPDENGGWFIGGEFSRVGGIERNGLAHILANGTLDPAWNPGANGPVYALAFSNSTLYVGGSFNNVGGQNRIAIAALEAATGKVTDWNPGMEGCINAMAIRRYSSSTLYVGGWFLRIGGYPCNRIAALDTRSNYASRLGEGADGEVFALALSDSAERSLSAAFSRASAAPSATILPP